jgi:hypothetical protein
MSELTVRGICGHAIQLPSTKPPQLVLDQLPLATDALPVNVLCPHCNRGTAYSPDKFRLTFFRRILPDQSRADQVCIVWQYECDEKGCKSPVNIHTPMTISEHMEQEALWLSVGIFAENVRCEGGHVCIGRAYGGALRVMVVPGWEPKQLDGIALDSFLA